MKKLFQEIFSGSLRQLPAEVTAENAPEGDAEEHFKAIVKTFEIASILWEKFQPLFPGTLSFSKNVKTACKAGRDGVQ